VRNACELAGITKHITPHSLRHAFATHSFEDGCDIRRIQKVLGHVRLETTTIYVTVATERTDMTSPLDRLETDAQSPAAASSPSASTEPPRLENPVGTFRVHTRQHPEDADNTPAEKRRHQITIELKGPSYHEFLTGTIAENQRPGYVRIDFPASEQWETILSQLPIHVATRIETPAFYQAVQRKITARLATLANKPNSRAIPITTPPQSPP